MAGAGPDARKMAAPARAARRMKKFLIVTADDFGSTEGINEAVHRASAAGVLTAASLMMGAPATADAVRRARDLPRLRVGLHLVLADGLAVLPAGVIPALVDREGRFGNRMLLDAMRYFALPAARRQLAAEIRAQFLAFAHTGLSLDHVNAHKHFHLHPTLLRTILQVGAEFGLSAVRVPDEPLWFATRAAPVAGLASSMLLAPWLAIMRRRLRARGIAHNDRVFGIACSGRLDEATLLEILGRLPAGTSEIYLHPTTQPSRAAQSSTATEPGVDELAALLSVRVSAAVAASGASLGGYSDLPCSARQ